MRPYAEHRIAAGDLLIERVSWRGKSRRGRREPAGRGVFSTDLSALWPNFRQHDKQLCFRAKSRRHGGHFRGQFGRALEARGRTVGQWRSPRLSCEALERGEQERCGARHVEFPRRESESAPQLEEGETRRWENGVRVCQNLQKLQDRAAACDAV